MLNRRFNPPVAEGNMGAGACRSGCCIVLSPSGRQRPETSADKFLEFFQGAVAPGAPRSAGLRDPAKGGVALIMIDGKDRLTAISTLGNVVGHPGTPGTMRAVRGMASCVSGAGVAVKRWVYVHRHPALDRWANYDHCITTN